MDFHTVKMYKDKNIVCDVKMFLTFTVVIKILQSIFFSKKGGPLENISCDFFH